MDFNISLPGFSLEDTLDCGQCFRWEKDENGIFHGVIGKKAAAVLQKGDAVTFFDTDETRYKEVFLPYFDLDFDYDGAKALLKSDPTMEKAIDFCGGIRILRQDPWETVCSFIISQNNNIPRIKGIILRLCQLFGEEQNSVFSFPTAEKLAGLTPEDLSPIRAGFRAKYLIDAAEKVASGELLLSSLYTLPMEEARAALKTVKGIGPKVAECILLYGFHRLEGFPIDTWIKKVMAEFYPKGFPEEFAPVAGIAQQYLFHAIRKGAL